MSWADLAPYAVLVLVGFLPNEIWRLLGIVASRGVSQDSEIVVFARAVATGILAGVVGKLILFPGGALAALPVAIRVGSAFGGYLGFLLMRRSMLAGVLSAEALLIIGGLVFL